MQNEPPPSPYTPPPSTTGSGAAALDAPTTASAVQQPSYGAPGGPYPPPPNYPPYGYGYGPPGYPQPYYPGPMPPSTSYFAIASLACALGGIVILFPLGAELGAILGVIFGHVALGDIKRSNGTKVGRRMAITGLVIGYVILALSILAFLIFFPTFFSLRRFHVYL